MINLFFVKIKSLIFSKTHIILFSSWLKLMLKN